MNIASVALLLVLSAAAPAAELPELMLPAGVGVNIHFTRGHEHDLDLIAAAGFKFIRIWNEPNIFLWKPKPDVAQYTALALAVGKAVRDADPQATLVAPASSTFPWEFLEGFLKSGVLEYLDGVSVHPYRNKTKPPETAAEDYRRLRELITRYAPSEAKRQMPILSGEWG